MNEQKELKEIKEVLTRIQIEIAKQTVDWNHHVKRTDLNDKRIDTLQKFMWLNLGGLAVIQILVAVSISFLRS